MNVFDEFKIIADNLAKSNISYALVGGVAMAFHGEPRFTKDIDILIRMNSFQGVNKILSDCGYSESSEPWTFRNTNITLYRFTKAIGEDLLVIDILVGEDKKHLEIIDNALEAKSDQSVVRVARKNDLIWLKTLRNSKQDQVDIERLSDDKD